MTVNGGEFVKENGVSCVLVNSDYGVKLIEKYGGKLILKPVDINKIKVINKQLERPATHSKLRMKIFKIYEIKGYQGVEKLYKKKILIEKGKMKIKKSMPKLVKNLIKYRKNKSI